MKLLFPAICILASATQAAWVVESIPTTIQYVNGGPQLLAKEMASAYRPIYNTKGKIGEYIAIAYRSRYLYLMQRQGTNWSTIRFDDNGRWPSIALDSGGNPHMSYFRTSNQKMYYAHPVAAGTGTCGPNLSWACEEIPTTLYGAPKGRSAITIHGSKIHLLVETPYDNPWYTSAVVRMTKTIGAPSWDTTFDVVSVAHNLDSLAIKTHEDGWPQALIDHEYLDWFGRTSSNWNAIGPLDGAGAFDISGAGHPRICYRDFAANRLIYARVNGTDSYWTETVVDWDIGTYGLCSIAIPEPGEMPSRLNIGARIAYFDDSGDVIKFATAPVLSSQPWSVETITPATGTRVLHLHLDKEARPTILYFDSGMLTLRMIK